MYIIYITCTHSDTIIVMYKCTYMYNIYTCSSDAILDCTHLKPVKHSWAMVSCHESGLLIYVHIVSNNLKATAIRHPLLDHTIKPTSNLFKPSVQCTG